MSYAMSGSSCPVFIAGIRYPSIFVAANEVDISLRWLNVSIKKNDGGPVIVKDQCVVTDSWVRSRIKKQVGVL